MPLIIVAGWPCSGKTMAANKINSFLQEKGMNTVLISDSNQLDVKSRNIIFNQEKLLKMLRSELKDQVTRKVSSSPTTFVILDAANSVKGYRYELYCVSKELKSTQVTVETVVSKDQVKEWNCHRKPESHRYDDPLISRLMDNYECCDNRNRWDTPLFPVIDGDIDLEGILLFLTTSKAPIPNQSTQTKTVSNSDHVAIVSSKTTEIVNEMMRLMDAGGGSGDMKIRGISFSLSHPVTHVQLTRIKRQFIKYMKDSNKSDITSLEADFIHFIVSNVSPPIDQDD